MKSMIVAFIATSAAAGIGIYYRYKRSSWEKLGEEQRIKRIMSIFETDVGCHLKDSAILRGKIRTFLEDGEDKLQILADFDKTLSRYYADGGQKAHSSFQVIQHNSHVGESVAEQLKGLHSKYYPIEMSTTISTEEKTPLMIEWYTSSIDIAIKSGIRKDLIPSMVSETLVFLRQGFDELLRRIKKLNIPLLVVSAGLGDVIDEVFIQQADLPPQVNVMANYFEYDMDGVAVGLKNEEMIHTFNKDKVPTMNKSYFDYHKKRTNVIVMGDTLGDPNMVDHAEHLRCVLKIGFLNSDVKQSLPEYLSVFDIVLTNDASLAVINVLLQELYNE